MHRWINLRFVLLEANETNGGERRVEDSSILPLWTRFDKLPVQYSLSLFPLTLPFLARGTLGPSLFSSVYDPLLQFPLSTYPSALFSFNLHAANAPRISSRPRHLRSSPPPPSTSFQLLSRRVSEEMLLEGIRRGAHGSSPVVALH